MSTLILALLVFSVVFFGRMIGVCVAENVVEYIFYRAEIEEHWLDQFERELRGPEYRIQISRWTSDRSTTRDETDRSISELRELTQRVVPQFYFVPFLFQFGRWEKGVVIVAVALLNLFGLFHFLPLRKMANQQASIVQVAPVARPSPPFRRPPPVRVPKRDCTGHVFAAIRLPAQGVAAQGVAAQPTSMPNHVKPALFSWYLLPDGKSVCVSKDAQILVNYGKPGWVMVKGYLRGRSCVFKRPHISQLAREGRVGKNHKFFCR